MALTGGIGSGKSYVCRLLGQRGIAIYDCDAAAKRLMLTSDSLKRQLSQLIGEDAYADGRPNKAVLTRFLLASESNAQAIDRIVHPAVAADFLQSGYRWMECAILFESGFDRLVDHTICVVAPTETRLQRVMQRDGISRSKALEWMQRQWPQEEVQRLSDFSIVNDGIQDLEKQIDTIIHLIKQ